MRSKKPERKTQLDKSVTIDELPLALSSETASVEFLEGKRWPHCPCCPVCGSVDVYKMKNANGQRSAKFMWRCRDCQKQYSVRFGTVYAESQIPLCKWLRGMAEFAACKNGVSSLELSRKLQISYGTCQ